MENYMDATKSDWALAPPAPIVAHFVPTNTREKGIQTGIFLIFFYNFFRRFPRFSICAVIYKKTSTLYVINFHVPTT